MITRDQVISIGTLSKPFGKQGQILCRLSNNMVSASGYKGDFIILSIDNILVPFRVTDWAFHGGDIVFSIAGITSENQARTLTNRETFMLRSDVSEDMEDEMLWTDFVGWEIEDTDQGRIGTITAVDDSTENILATICPDLSHPQYILIPLHEDFIQKIDEVKHILTLTLPFHIK